MSEKLVGVSQDRWTTEASDLLDFAWGVIANAYRGDWEKANVEWHEAACKWRDLYFERLKETN